jgi:diphosphomevalonate decarboxylase
MQPKTIEVIKRIRAYRTQTKVPVGFTLDAGPNIHLLYPEKYKKEINSFIHKELSQYCMHDYFISDCIGEGPVRI